MSIATELTALAANKAAIKAAIEAKNPTVAPTDALSQWPTSIASIGGGGHEGWIYGYVIDESDSNPATRVTYIEDNAEYSPLYMDFANDTLVWGSWKSWVEEYFRPAMLTSAGVIDYYLDPNDLTKKADGVTASDVANTNYDGNAMLIVKPIYYNIKRAGLANVEVRFSNIKQGDDWYNWTHLESDGTYAEFCGWPLFPGVVTSSKMRSIATNTIASGSISQSDEYTYATNNGSNWYPTTWADEMMIRLLFPLLCRSTDSQEKIGGGASRSSLSAKCGDLYNKGYFYGKATVTSSTQYGSKFLCMENVWGERWRRSVGIAFYNGVFYVKLTPSTVDGSKTNAFITSNQAESYTSNYIPAPAGTAVNWNGNTVAKIINDPIMAMIPATCVNADMTTNYCDAIWTSSGLCAVIFGGDCSNGMGAGVFTTAAGNSPSFSTWGFGASLSYHFF